MQMNPMAEFRTQAVRRQYPEAAAIIAIVLLSYASAGFRLIFG